LTDEKVRKRIQFLALSADRKMHVRKLGQSGQPDPPNHLTRFDLVLPECCHGEMAKLQHDVIRMFDDRAVSALSPAYSRRTGFNRPEIRLTVTHSYYVAPGRSQYLHTPSKIPYADPEIEAVVPGIGERTWDRHGPARHCHHHQSNFAQSTYRRSGNPGGQD
jgi:hypothetical protein